MVEPGHEGIETLEDGDNSGDHKASPCHVGLERARPGQSAPSDSLSLECLHEADVGEQDAHPGESTEDSDERNKVREHLQAKDSVRVHVVTDGPRRTCLDPESTVKYARPQNKAQIADAM